MHSYDYGSLNVQLTRWRLSYCTGQRFSVLEGCSFVRAIKEYSST